MEGNVKKITDLEGKDLIMCPGLNFEKNKSLRFGINFDYSCQVDPEQFFGSTQMEFIVPYLQFWQEKTSVLYPVPVLIKNIGRNEVSINKFCIHILLNFCNTIGRFMQINL